MMDSVHVRQSLDEALNLDLTGPANGTELEKGVLPQAPARW